MTKEIISLYKTLENHGFKKEAQSLMNTFISSIDEDKQESKLYKPEDDFDIKPENSEVKEELMDENEFNQWLDSSIYSKKIKKNLNEKQLDFDFLESSEKKIKIPGLSKIPRGYLSKLNGETLEDGVYTDSISQDSYETELFCSNCFKKKIRNESICTRCKSKEFMSAILDDEPAVKSRISNEADDNFQTFSLFSEEDEEELTAKELEELLS